MKKPMQQQSLIAWTFIAALFAGATLVPTSRLAQAADNLETPMKAMLKDLNALKKQVKEKEQSESSLKLLADMEKNILLAKGMLPPTVQKLTGDEKTKAIASYRAMMLSLMREVLTAEEQVLDAKFDDALKTVTGLEDIEKAGHKEFIKGEE